MRPRMLMVRFLIAMLMVTLGLLIVGRGLIESAPLTFTAMGALMTGLGIYRLRLMSGRAKQH